MTDLAGGQLGAAGTWDLKFEEKKLVLSLDAGHTLGTAGVVIKLDAPAVIDALAKAIPGTIDDAIFGVIKAAL